MLIFPSRGVLAWILEAALSAQQMEVFERKWSYVLLGLTYVVNHGVSNSMILTVQVVVYMFSQNIPRSAYKDSLILYLVMTFYSITLFLAGIYPIIDPSCLDDNRKYDLLFTISFVLKMLPLFAQIGFMFMIKCSHYVAIEEQVGLID